MFLVLLLAVAFFVAVGYVIFKESRKGTSPSEVGGGVVTEDGILRDPRTSGPNNSPLNPQ